MNIKELLEHKYNSDTFESFIRDRFSGLEIRDVNYTDDGLSQSEKQHIRDYKYLGKVELDDGKDIGFFEFRSLAPQIENKRVGYNAILKKLAYDNVLDGAIASFFHEDSNAWRLSFVGFEYDEGKANVTNLKRYTYVLGKDIPIKTPYQQLKDLKYPNFYEIQNAFSVEAIGKEFYKGLVKEYEKLLNEYITYPSNDDNRKKEFAIRLIGRILFIKFLNKKSLISDDIFEVTSNYYHEKLEPLFFEQLNTPKSERKKEFTNDAIPFLNGGLFEPLNLDFYEWNGDESRYAHILKVDDRFFIEL